MSSGPRPESVIQGESLPDDDRHRKRFSGIQLMPRRRSIAFSSGGGRVAAASRKSLHRGCLASVSGRNAITKREAVGSRSSPQCKWCRLKTARRQSDHSHCGSRPIRPRIGVRGARWSRCSPRHASAPLPHITGCLHSGVVSLREVVRTRVLGLDGGACFERDARRRRSPPG